MTVNNEPDVASARAGTVPGWRKRLPLSEAPREVILFLILFATTVVLQVASGAYHSEFGGYSDEPAHYVTSLMVREYITELKPPAPLHFAQQYYSHYPKVAFGHWPPLLYIVQAFWMVLFSAARASILLELAATTALIGYSVYCVARSWFGKNAAVSAGLLTVCLPLMQTYTDEEMSETLLVLTCFWSAIFFARYIDSERWQDSWWFGLFFSLAVLTKGSGWLLAIVPPIALVLTRKLRLLLRPGFWLAVLVIAVLCLPWQLMTLHMAEQGWTGGSQPSIGYTLRALRQFFLVLTHTTGPVLFLLVGIGLVLEISKPLRRKSIPSTPAVMAALLFAVWVFHSLVPAGIEDRKMIIAVPALILFLFGGGFWVADHLPLPGGLERWRRPAVALAGALAFFLQTFTVPHQKHYGYIEAAKFITSDPRLRDATILVSSGSIGEGLLVSEVAMRKPRPRDTIIRATKALAQVNWDGSNYRGLFSTPADIVNYLDRQHVALIVTDTFVTGTEFPHNRLLKQTIAQSGRFQPIATFRSGSSPTPGAVQLYRFLPQ